MENFHFINMFRQMLYVLVFQKKNMVIGSDNGDFLLHTTLLLDEQFQPRYLNTDCFYDCSIGWIKVSGFHGCHQHLQTTLTFWDFVFDTLYP